MNKKDYIDAINEIEVGDELKRKTFEKVKQKKNYTKSQTKLVWLLLNLYFFIFFNQ